MRVAASLVALALILPPGGQAQQSPPRDTRVTPDAATGQIIGVVTIDETSAPPLRRARVMLRGPGLDMGRSVMTGDDGSFVFDRVPAGRFTVRVEKPGYVAMNYGATRAGRPGIGVQVPDRQTVRIAMRVPRGAVITGTVLDIDGQPVQGITVNVMTRQFMSSEGEYRYMSVAAPGPATDDRGVYRVFGLPAGEYYVAAQPSGGRGSPPFTPATVLRMMSRGVPDERTVALAQVFHPDAVDMARASRVVAKAGEERAGVDIQLQYVALASISGVAPAAAGWAPPMVTMTRLDDPTGYPGGRLTRADGDGHFAFTSVPPGSYRIAARSTAGPAPSAGRGGDPSSGSGLVLVASAEVQVAGEDIANLVLTLQQALTISGRVIFQGTRAAPPLGDMSVNVPLFLKAVDSGYGLPRVQIQAGGTFHVDGVIPGRYRGFSAMQGVTAPIGSWWVKSLSSGGRELLDAPIEINRSLDDLVLTLADDTSALTGVVVDEARSPVPEAYVVAFSADRAMWFQNSRRVGAVHPDRSGHYAILNLAPGDYRVAVADLDQNEWFDPAVLERLLPAAAPLRIAGSEKQVLDLTWRGR